MEIMEQCCLSIDLHEEYAQKGSNLAISDVGVGVALCRAALIGASLNVFINTKAMTNREKAAEINRKAEELLARYVPMADAIADGVRDRLG
jgi:formiminotetrahydrofolate cyclodeaminase